MDFFETVEKRRSIRAFDKKDVDAKTIKKLLETINLAPSAGNLQAYRIYIVRSAEKKAELVQGCLYQESVAQAPLLLIFSALKGESEEKYGERGHDFYSIQDATIAAAYCQLAATALGLSSVWVGGFDPLEVSRIIDAEEEEVPVAVIPLGYPAENPEKRARKNIKELIREI